METTERIVEAYVRYVKGWATIANIRCAGQNEIDLLAIDPKSLARYHIEVSISISGSFRALTGKPYDPEKAKQRVHQASQRRTLGFFAEKKFAAPGIVERLEEFGFKSGAYTRAIVTWGWDADAAEQAVAAGIELWDFRDIIREIGDKIRGASEYFADDTLRTLNLFIHANDEAERRKSRSAQKPIRVDSPAPSLPAEPIPGRFWVYENWTNEQATVHCSTCSFCNDGKGMGGKSATANGEWLGPFETLETARHRSAETKRKRVGVCGICLRAGSGEAPVVHGATNLTPSGDEPDYILD